MVQVTYHVKGWEDGEYSERELDAFDRWCIHSAEQVQVSIDGTHVLLNQKPNALTGARVGVGACLWEGAVLLAAYLASQPLHRYVGARAVELGAGVGLVGLALARWGAQVHLTDKAAVLPLLQENADLNKLSTELHSATVGGGVEVAELEWGALASARTLERLATRSLDYVLAADCCYVDNDGVSPSVSAFVSVCAALSAAHTRVLVAFEVRSQLVRQQLLDLARAMFSQVRQIPTDFYPKGLQVEHMELYEFCK